MSYYDELVTYLNSAYVVLGGVAAILCAVTMLLIVTYKKPIVVVSAAEVSATQVWRGKSIFVSPRLVRTAYKVALEYEGLTCVVNDKQLYDAYVEGSSVKAYVLESDTGIKSLSIEETMDA